jgi:hypothetical protein
MESRRQALSLYRRILRLHRQKLEPVMRVLGDRYVREEFKLHKNAKQEFIQGFLSEWQQYHDQVAAKHSTFGQDLSMEHRRLLNEDQKKKLDDLRIAATKEKSTE